MIKPSFTVDDGTLLDTIALIIRDWAKVHLWAKGHGGGKSLAGLSMFSGQYLYIPIVKDAQAWGDALDYFRSNVALEDIPVHSGAPHLEIVGHFMEVSEVMPFLNAHIVSKGENLDLGMKMNVWCSILTKLTMKNADKVHSPLVTRPRLLVTRKELRQSYGCKSHVPVSTDIEHYQLRLPSAVVGEPLSIPKPTLLPYTIWLTIMPPSMTSPVRPPLRH
jgi:hypothetical protein